MNSPKNFFLQLGIIVTLYASVISFLAFVFAVIDDLLPTAQEFYYYGFSSGIRYSISVLIVMFPLFIWMSKLHRKAVISNPELQESKLRKWLVYLTLFLAGLAIAIDVVVLVYTFLGGENFALPFVLKVLSVLLVAGGVFYFYLKDVRGYWDMKPRSVKTITGVVTAVVLASVIGGIVLIGSPAKQRALRNDAQRINDLISIQFQVVEYYQYKGKLPSVLNEVIDQVRGNSLPKDPETNVDYKYELTGPLSFRICANFKTDSSENIGAETSRMIYNPFDEAQQWEHGIGEKCFDRVIDTDRYPIINK